MKRIILLMTLAALVVVGTLLAFSVAGAQKHRKPAQITIKRGTKVRWINKDMHPHTATAINGKSFDSGRLGKGQSYTHTFKSAGTKKYLCEIHPFMRGSVVVKR
jgi:plastocyanin